VAGAEIAKAIKATKRITAFLIMLSSSFSSYDVLSMRLAKNNHSGAELGKSCLQGR
jgi:hypothetical protein